MALGVYDNTAKGIGMPVVDNTAKGIGLLVCDQKGGSPKSDRGVAIVIGSYGLPVVFVPHPPKP